jgi:hypothetical protein
MSPWRNRSPNGFATMNASRLPRGSLNLVLPLPRQQKTGAAWRIKAALSTSPHQLGGKFVLRFCMGASNTQLHHVEQAWRRIQQEA